MYVVESGNFNVLKNDQIVSTECGPGFTFGELSLLYGENRSATIVCSEDAVIWALDRHTFRDFQDQNERHISKLALKVLPKIPVLKDLSRAQLVKVSEIARIVEFEEASIINEMNVMGNTFYIVIEGIVIGSKSELIYGIGEESSCRSMSQGDMSLGSSSSFRNSADAGEKKENEEEETKEQEEETKEQEKQEEEHEVKPGRWSLSSFDRNKNQKKEFRPPAKKNSGSLKNCTRYKAGDWFGEESLSRKIYETNVVADSTVRLLAFDMDSFEAVIGNIEDIKEKYKYQDILLALPLLSNLSQERKLEAIDMFTLETYKHLTTIIKAGDKDSKFVYLKEGEMVD